MTAFTRGALQRPYAFNEGGQMVVDPINAMPEYDVLRWTGPGLMLPQYRQAVDPSDPSTWNGLRVFPGTNDM